MRKCQCRERGHKSNSRTYIKARNKGDSDEADKEGGRDKTWKQGQQRRG